MSQSRAGWPCHGCGKRVERSGSACCICCRPGRRGGACGRARAWSAAYPSRPCGRRPRDRRVIAPPSWSAVRSANSSRMRFRPRPGGPAVAKRDLLVGLRLSDGDGCLHCQNKRLGGSATPRGTPKDPPCQDASRSEAKSTRPSHPRGKRSGSAERRGEPHHAYSNDTRPLFPTTPSVIPLASPPVPAPAGRRPALRVARL